MISAHRARTGNRSAPLPLGLAPLPARLHTPFRPAPFFFQQKYLPHRNALPVICHLLSDGVCHTFSCSNSSFFVLQSRSGFDAVSVPSPPSARPVCPPPCLCRHPFSTIHSFELVVTFAFLQPLNLKRFRWVSSGPKVRPGLEWSKGPVRHLKGTHSTWRWCAQAGVFCPSGPVGSFPRRVRPHPSVTAPHWRYASLQCPLTTRPARGPTSTPRTMCAAPPDRSSTASTGSASSPRGAPATVMPCVPVLASAPATIWYFQ